MVYEKDDCVVYWFKYPVTYVDYFLLAELFLGFAIPAHQVSFLEKYF
jgi:hypothetical protein